MSMCFLQSIIGSFRIPDVTSQDLIYLSFLFLYLPLFFFFSNQFCSKLVKERNISGNEFYIFLVSYVISRNNQHFSYGQFNFPEQKQKVIKNYVFLKIISTPPTNYYFYFYMLKPSIVIPVWLKLVQLQNLVTFFCLQTCLAHAGIRQATRIPPAFSVWSV